MISIKDKGDLVEFDIVWAVALVVYIINLLALSFYDLKFRPVPDYLLLIALITSFFVTKFDF